MTAVKRVYYTDVEQKLTARRTIAASGCWEYAHGVGNRGYGCVRAWGSARPAHIVAAIIWIGARPEGAICCHRCDNRLCINPEHLYWGTYKSNSRDMMTRGRGAGQFVAGKIRGEAHPKCKLTEDQVREIKGTIIRGYYHGLYAELARRFRVSVQAINRINKGKVWGWVRCE